MNTDNQFLNLSLNFKYICRYHHGGFTYLLSYVQIAIDTIILAFLRIITSYSILSQQEKVKKSS